MRRLLWSLACAVVAAVRFVDVDIAESEREELRGAVSRAAGIYADREKRLASAGDPSSALLVVSFNRAYVAFYESWACHAARLGLRHLAWPVDASGAAKAREGLSRDGGGGGGGGGELFFSHALADQLRLGSDASGFRQREFNALSVAKLVIVRVLLVRTGLSVWFSDVDVAFARDPWPALRHDAPACDYVFAPNRADWDGARAATREGNTGFHVFRRGRGALELLRRALALAGDDPSKDDQFVVWAVLNRRGANVTVVRAGELDTAAPAAPAALGGGERAAARDAAADDGRLRACALPIELFPTGNLIAPQRRARRELDRTFLASGKMRGALAVHANFVAGRAQKVELLELCGLWAIPRTRGGGCDGLEKFDALAARGFQLDPWELTRRWQQNKTRARSRRWH